MCVYVFSYAYSARYSKRKLSVCHIIHMCNFNLRLMNTRNEAHPNANSNLNSNSEFAIQLQLPPIWGRLVAIQTIAPQFMLYNLCDDHKLSRSFSICKTIFMTSPATISDTIFGNCLPSPLSPATSLVSHLKWTQIVCVRFIDAHPSDTTAFDQARRRWQRRRRRTCLSALCMTVCVCFVCVPHSTS